MLLELLKTYNDEDLISDGENALMWAAKSTLNYDKLLLLKQSKPDFVAQHFHDRGLEGRTVLHYAAGGVDDSAEAIKILVEWGADVNAQDDYLWTPLHEAALDNGHCDRRFAALKACGADVSLKTD